MLTLAVGAWQRLRCHPGTANVLTWALHVFLPYKCLPVVPHLAQIVA